MKFCSEAINYEFVLNNVNVLESHNYSFLLKYYFSIFYLATLSTI